MSLVVNPVTARLANALGAGHLSIVNRVGKRVLRKVTGNELTVKASGLTFSAPVEAWDVLGQLGRGAFEPYEAQLFDAILRRGMRVIDLGANIGYYTLRAARSIGPTGHVYAFEPDPRTAPYLRRNVARNAARNVSVIEAAASGRSGEAVFRQSGRASHSGLHHTMSEHAPIAVSVVTSRVDDHVQGPVDVVKMDIEGEEPAALQGMAGILSSSPALRLFTEFSPRALEKAGNQPQAFMDWMKSNFEIVASINEHDQSLRTLVEPPARRLNVFCSRVGDDERLLAGDQ